MTLATPVANAITAQVPVTSVVTTTTATPLSAVKPTSVATLPTEMSTVIDVCPNTNNCQIIARTSVTGILTTCTATYGTTETISAATDKKISKYTITTFIQTITEIYPGYVTTITTLSNGVLMTYSTYYPPTTSVVLQTVTGIVPVEDSFIGTSSDVGTNFKDRNGLINIVLSLWIVMWSLVYMISL
ncbi:22080_t:CDS:2 [Dentiscutata erythropus]|uniref:22080_t:CDS:1 n=1 Tax=Dentiscutata erythropus TaxID=1348616 RepID=A0A9N9BTU9_9GLOM|nr:22080_t:CDS:2 [Dentiscutata erythropus]